MIRDSCGSKMFGPVESLIGTPGCMNLSDGETTFTCVDEKVHQLLADSFCGNDGRYGGVFVEQEGDKDVSSTADKVSWMAWF